MFFVLDRQRLEHMIRLTRDDQRKKRQGDDGPYFRIEADVGHVRLSGRRAEVRFPATVYEPGVLFLHITVLRRLLATMRDSTMLSIQVNADGLMVENVRLSLDVGQMLLYPSPGTATQRHPSERSDAPAGASERTLFDR